MHPPIQQPQHPQQPRNNAVIPPLLEDNDSVDDSNIGPNSERQFSGGVRGQLLLPEEGRGSQTEGAASHSGAISMAGALTHGHLPPDEGTVAGTIRETTITPTLSQSRKIHLNQTHKSFVLYVQTNVKQDRCLENPDILNPII
jgi:hypothetical protein